jgi:three-Cys-motif partner protein
VKDTGEWIDGSPVTAWKKSCEGGAPFSKVIIADLDKARLEAATARLQALGAPVLAIHGPAWETAFRALQGAAIYGLNFAFLDPFSIGALDFEIFKTLSRLKRIDILAHVSKMDLQRNLSINLAGENSQFDQFAPGWRDAVDLKQQQATIRRDVMEYWRMSVANTGIATSEDTTLITGSKGQHLYWLLLAAKHDLAHKFWKASSRTDQTAFDF